MFGFESRAKLLMGGALAVAFSASLTGSVVAQMVPETPNFSETGWINENTFNGGGMVEMRGQTYFKQDPAHPFVGNNTGAQPTYRIADLASNPNVKQWAKDAMKKDNDEVLAGKIAYTARSSCDPAGVPGFDMFGFQPMFFLQTPKEVTMIYAGDQQVRHIYMDVPHSQNVKPSWYGESVGHYEGDTLVIDTIGLNDKTQIDNYRTPHTDKLHVVERWRIVEAGSIMEVTFTVDDPDTYEKPWSARQRFRHVLTPYTEEVCIEGNLVLHQWQLHIADKPDFE